MSNPQVEMTLDNLDGGALAELIQKELRNIGASIADPNFKASAKRKLSVSIEFAPDEKGQTCSITYSVKASLPGMESGKCMAFVAMKPGSKAITFFEPPRLPFDNGEPLPNIAELEARRA